MPRTPPRPSAPPCRPPGWRAPVGPAAGAPDATPSRPRTAWPRRWGTPHAGAAPDAGGGVHRELGIALGHEERVRLGRAPRARGDESACLDDPIEGPAV